VISGFRIRLAESGVVGWVGTRNISSTCGASTNPLHLLRVGKEQHFRVMKFEFDPERGVKCELSCKSSDLQMDSENDKVKNEFFDALRYNDDVSKAKAEKQKIAESNLNNYTDRIITHHAFHNVKFKDAEVMLESMHQVGQEQ